MKREMKGEVAAVGNEEGIAERNRNLFLSFN